MTITLNFNAKKRFQNAANLNVHDDVAWGVSYEIAATLEPADKLPQQLAVHYIYEMLNRPWQAEHDNIKLVTQWLEDLRNPAQTA